MTPEEIELEIQRREALSRGKSFTVVDGKVVETETIMPQKVAVPAPGGPQAGIRMENPPAAPFIEQGPGAAIGHAVTQGVRTLTGQKPKDLRGVEVGTQKELPPEARDPGNLVDEEIARREALAARKASAGEGPVADAAAWIGQYIPPNLRPAVEGVSRVGANFNEAMVRALGIAPDAADELMRKIGVKLWDKPGAATATLRRELNALGIPTARTNDLEGQIGRGLWDGMVTAGAMMAAAPYMIATKGTTAVGQVVKKVGEWIKKNPGANLSTNLGASSGAQIAEEEIGGPVATFLGAVAGSFAPGAAVKLLQGATYPARLAGRIFNPKAGPTAPPVLPPGTNTQVAREFAAGERVAQTERLANERQGLIETTGGPRYGDPNGAQAIYRDRLTDAARAYRAREEELWRPFQNVEVSPGGLVEYVRALDASLPPSAVNSRPTEFIQRIQQLYTRMVDAQPGGAPGSIHIGQPLPPTAGAAVKQVEEIVPTTIGDLMTLRSEVLAAAAAARVGANPNRPLAMNLGKLAEAILEQITLVTRGSAHEGGILDARRFSKVVNDLFTRGPVGRVLRQTTDRGVAVSPEQTVERQMQAGRPDAFGQVATMADTGPAGLGQFRTLQSAEDAVRALFSEAAQKAPGGAQAWMKRNAKAIGSLARLGNELETVAGRIEQINSIEKRLRTDALARFIGSDPQNTYARLFSSPTAVEDARAIMGTVSLNRDAQEAFRAGLVQHLVFAGSGSGNQMKAILAQPRVAAMFREVLDPAALARLRRIIETGARYEGGVAGNRLGERTFSDRFVVGAPTIFARIVGAQVGSSISHMVGRGNIQGPAIVSGVFRNWAAEVFRGITPQELITRAILDPRWEAILYSKVPQNFKEMRQFHGRLKLLIRTYHGYIKEPQTPTDYDESVDQ